MTFGDPPGTVVISVDAELGWGHHDLTDARPERIEYARTGWIRLLDLLETYRLPATWAIVGHLFLDDCDGHHDDHPAPDGWFASEHTRWVDRPELRFGFGLVERVQAAHVDHELANHGFSHLPFNHPEMTPELARAELRASHRAAGQRFDTFVFPRNRVGHLDVLADEGYTCYRGPTPRVSSVSFPRAAKLRRGVLGSPPTVTPRIDEHRLVDVPASLPLFSFEGPGRLVLETLLEDPISRLVSRGIDLAACTGGTLHVWLHPNNLWSDAAGRRLHEVFGTIATARDEGVVTVETMGAVAERVRAAQLTADPA